MRLGLTIFVVIFLACQSSRRHWHLVDKNRSISSDIKSLVDTLVKYGQVHDDAVGYAGEKSNIYEAFENLSSRATEDDLLQLTAHSDPTVRVYAFWALAKRSSERLTDILYRHRKDNARFSYMSGCEMGPEHVNTFLLNLVTPGLIDTEVKKLLPSDLSKFQTIIR